MCLSLVVPFATYGKMQDRLLALCAVLGDSVQPWACSNLIRCVGLSKDIFLMIAFLGSGALISLIWIVSNDACVGIDGSSLCAMMERFRRNLIVYGINPLG